MERSKVLIVIGLYKVARTHREQLARPHDNVILGHTRIRQSSSHKCEAFPFIISKCSKYDTQLKWVVAKYY